MFEGLEHLRTTLPAEGWGAVRELAQQHPLSQRILRDPMARRSYEKPRGYAGDVVLRDYIYRLKEPEADDAIGRAIYDYAVGRPAACAVRNRRERLAFAIDRAIDRASDRADGRAQVLSIACGHLREAELSPALRGGRVERLVALDADTESLAVVDGLGLPCLETVVLSVGRLLGRADRIGRFDLVYSACLYDYLEPELGRRLTACLFSRCKPGGQLVVTDFLLTVPDAGYMETCMGWELIYRTVPELEALAASIPPEQIAAVECERDAFGAIAYLTLTRAEE